MFAQLHSRNFPIALRQGSKSSCFGVSCNRPSTRRRQQVMTRADAAHDGRDSIAFTGSAGEHTTPHTEVVQGVEPAPRPVSQQPPSVWAAGIALGLGLACAVAWRQLSGHNSKKKAERQQRAVPTSLRTAPATQAPRSTSQGNTSKPDFSNSLSATQTAPAVNRSPSPDADARTVRDRSAEQRKPAADAMRFDAASAPRKLAEQATEKPTQQMTQNLAEKPAEKPTQKPAEKPAQKPPSSQAPPPQTSGPAQTEAKPSQRGLSSNKLPSNSAAAAAAEKLSNSPPAQAAPSAAAAPPSKQSQTKPSPTGLSDKAQQADAAGDTPRKQGIPSSSGPAIAAESRTSAPPSSKQTEANSSPTGLPDTAKQADAAGDAPRKQGVPSSSGPAIAAESTGSVQPSSKQSEAKSSPIDKPKQSGAAAGAPPKRDSPSSSQAVTAAQPSPKQTDTKPSRTELPGKEKLSGAAPAVAPTAAAKQQEAEPKPKGMPSPQGTSAPASAKSDTASDYADSLTAEPIRGSATAAPASSKAAAGSSGSAPSSAGKLSTEADAQQKKTGEGKAADKGGDAEGDSLHDLIAASSKDEEVPEAFKTFDGNLPDDPEPDTSQRGPKLFQSAPKTDATLPPSQSPSQSPTRGSPPKQGAAAGQDLEAQPLQPASEEEAAQLRQRMQQLRQAMAGKEADLAAAEEEASAQPAQQQQQQEQQQQQADKQSSEFRQQQEELAEAAQQEGDKQQAKLSEKQQQGIKAGQGEKAAVDAKPRVLARPSSGESATIFLEKPGAGEGLRPSPAGDEGEQSIDLVAVAAGIVLPHPDKTDTGGEDAFFVSSHGRGAFGVADGVGGWNLEGVDPSRYSRLLMEHAEKAVLRGKGDSEDGARDVVGFAHHSITRQSEEEGDDILGSSTICVGVMRPGGVVEIANLGDSGFRVLRGSEIVFASEAQQHSFNMPYQLAVPGPDQYSDTSESAVVYELELHPGDVIIVATDGVLDNLWDSQMAMLVHQFLGAEPRSVASAQACARMLVKIARYNSLDPNIRSPWAVESARMGEGPWWKRLRPAGGKVDDCTAVVVCLEPAGAVWDSDRQAVVSGGQAAVAVV